MVSSPAAAVFIVSACSGEVVEPRATSPWMSSTGQVTRGSRSLVATGASTGSSNIRGSSSPVERACGSISSSAQAGLLARARSIRSSTDRARSATNHSGAERLLGSGTGGVGNGGSSSTTARTSDGYNPAAAAAVTAPIE